MSNTTPTNQRRRAQGLPTYQAAQLYARRQAGKCVDCGKRRTTATYCRDCAERHNASTRSTYWRRRHAGLCVKCEAPAAGARCDACAEREAALRRRGDRR